MTLSKERLEEIADGYTPSHQEYVGLARELLERRERDTQEPVAYLYPGDATEWRNVALAEDLDDEQKAACIPLCAPQPAPVAHKPVAWVTEGWVQNRACEWGEIPEGKSPVVGSKYWDLETFDGNEEWLKEAVANTGAKPLYSEPQPVQVPAHVPDRMPYSVYQVLYEQCDGFVNCNPNTQIIWNACRAAMLNGGKS